MYQRKRKTEYTKRDSRYRSDKAFACVGKIIILFSIFSCAHKFSVLDLKNPAKTLSSATTKICVSGEGQGRITYKGRRIAFKFESLLKMDRWLIAVNIPFHGEEVLILDKIGSSTPRISGSLSKRIRETKKLFSFFSRIIGLKEANCISTRAGEGVIAGLCNEISTVLRPREIRLEKSGYYLQASGRGIDYFDQIKLGMVQHGKEVVKMELSLANCTTTQ